VLIYADELLEVRAFLDGWYEGKLLQIFLQDLLSLVD
jgi:hypothetical protein